MSNNKRSSGQLQLKELFSGGIANPYVFPLLAFIVPLVIRIIPEILMGPYLVGFDTVSYYVPYNLIWLKDIWTFLGTAPFFYVVLMSFTSIGIPVVVSLKVLSPLLLGLLGICVYFYASKTLSWSPRKSLLVVLFATLYFVALRVSFDMLRTELALTFLFVTIMFLKKNEHRFRNGVVLSIAMLSVVFAHQLVAVIMFAIVLATIIHLYLEKEMATFHRFIVCSVPAVVLFFVVVYAGMVSSHFPLISDFPSQSVGGHMGLFGFASYGDLFVNTFGFLLFCYLPLLPFLVVGAKRFKGNLQLKTWIFWILFSLLLILISPNVFFDVLPYRWILLLTYPLAFYATEAFIGLKLNTHKVGVVLVLATLSISFIVLPSNLAFPYFNAFPSYIPTSMLQNTVPLSDCQDTVNVLQWIHDHMDNGSRLLVHDAFYGWASLSLDGDQLILYGYDNPADVALKLEENGLTCSLYMIWWRNGSGWHGQPTVSSAFNIIYESGKMAAFKYNYNAS